eukprot:scaffold36735_cov65-Cyclotella_meneghiniana.AAC.7
MGPSGSGVGGDPKCPPLNFVRLESRKCNLLRGYVPIAHLCATYSITLLKPLKCTPQIESTYYKVIPRRVTLHNTSHFSSPTSMGLLGSGRRGDILVNFTN